MTAKPEPVRQRARRKEARPGEIIEAGLREFSAHGFAATRLEDVARRAGVVKGTIYRYFADKEALFEAVVRANVPALIEVDGLIDSFTGSTRELILHVLQVMYVEVVDSNLRTLMRIIISEGGKFPALVELYYRESVGRARPFLERIVARGVARGEVHADHAKLAPMMIAAPAVMAVVWKLTFEAVEPIATQDFFAAHVDVLFRGLLVRP